MPYGVKTLRLSRKTVNMPGAAIAWTRLSPGLESTPGRGDLFSQSPL